MNWKHDQLGNTIISWKGIFHWKHHSELCWKQNRYQFDGDVVQVQSDFSKLIYVSKLTMVFPS